MQIIKKPKLVFFRFIAKNLPGYVLMHLQEQSECLSEFFDVIVITENCDYKKICDLYRPDIAVFESGVYAGSREIKNTSAYPEIPKVGFCNADAYCLTRSVFLSDMDRWGISTYFTLSVSMPDYTHPISDRLFVWPNFINPGVYKDYGETKIIPLLLTGSQAAHYPWRKRINKIVAQNYPSLVCPHFGWFNDTLTKKMTYGEHYARMINASSLAPTCGTIANELVRKHLEIPGCKSCLVTEKTPTVEAAGFIDMQNCIFADSSSVLDKIDFLFNNPEELGRITQAGFDLVHSQHTYKQRNQLFQWLELNKNLKQHEKIIQINPFKPLVVVNKNSSKQGNYICSNGQDRKLLYLGYKKLMSGDYNDAEQFFICILNYHYIPEAVLRLAICNLYNGKASKANTLLANLIERSIKIHGARDPDPVEWAYFIVSLLCQGSVGEAIVRANEFSYIHHIELERVLRLVKVIDKSIDKFNINERQKYSRTSIHELLWLSDSDWALHVKKMFNGCGQDGLIKFLANLNDLEINNRNEFVPVDSSKISRHPENNNFTLIKKSFYIRFYSWLMRKKEFAYKILCSMLQHFVLSSQVISKKKIKDGLASVIEKLSREEEIESVLFIGASDASQYAQALLDGVSNNPIAPIKLFFTALLFNSFFNFQVHGRVVDILDYDKCLIKMIKEKNNITSFGLVIFDGENFTECVPFEDVVGSRIIIINGLNNFNAYCLYDKMCNDNYVLISHEFGRVGGYAVFLQRTLRSSLVF